MWQRLHKLLDLNYLILVIDFAKSITGMLNLLFR